MPNKLDIAVMVTGIILIARFSIIIAIILTVVFLMVVVLTRKYKRELKRLVAENEKMIKILEYVEINEDEGYDTYVIIFREENQYQELIKHVLRGADEDEVYTKPFISDFETPVLTLCTIKAVEKCSNILVLYKDKKELKCLVEKGKKQ